MRGVFLDLRTVDRDDLDLTSLRSSVKEWEYHDWTAPDQIIERVRHADIVVSNKVRLEGITLRSADRLKLICIAATAPTTSTSIHAAAWISPFAMSPAMRHRRSSSTSMRRYSPSPDG